MAESYSQRMVVALMEEEGGAPRPGAGGDHTETVPTYKGLPPVFMCMSE